MESDRHLLHNAGCGLHARGNRMQQFEQKWPFAITANAVAVKFPAVCYLSIVDSIRAAIVKSQPPVTAQNGKVCIVCK